MHFIRHPEYLTEYVAYFDNKIQISLQCWVCDTQRWSPLPGKYNHIYKMLSALFCKEKVKPVWLYLIKSLVLIKLVFYQNQIIYELSNQIFYVYTRYNEFYTFYYH